MAGESGPVTLVDEYRRLRQCLLESSRKDADQEADGRRLDAIYETIVSKPIGDIHTALEKLWFAHHCLTEEEDFKEAGNLVHEVCLALEDLFAGSLDNANVA